MVQLSALLLLCILSCTLSDDPCPPPFWWDCCTQKTVGGVGYHQVPGDTDGFSQCKKGCVYEKDGDIGSRFCFQSGGSNPQKTECTEPFLDSMYIFVTRNTDNLIFKTDIGAFSCDISSGTAEGENITCVEDNQLTEGIEKAAFFYSKSSDGKRDWMHLHTENEAIHCEFDDGLGILLCLKVSTKGEHDVLFVEGAEIAEGHGLDEQLEKCGEKCNARSKLPDTDPKKCTFWTLSYWDGDHTTTPSHNNNDHEHGGRQARNHAKTSECGIRNYDPKVRLTTNPDQYAGCPEKNQTYKGVVFVFEVIADLSPHKCKEKCLEEEECRTWTWDRKTSLCSLNVYTPTRRIDISDRTLTPNLLSGCIESLARNWTCPKLATTTTTSKTTPTTTTSTTNEDYDHHNRPSTTTPTTTTTTTNEDQDHHNRLH